MQTLTKSETFELRTLEHQATVLVLLGTILRICPEEEWLESIVKEEVFEDIPYGSEEESVIKGKALLKTWTQCYRKEKGSFDACYSDYMNLFVGPGKPLAPPWESTYAASEECLVFQKETLEVRTWYRTFGLQIDKLHHEPDDHISYELEFLGTLAQRAGESLSQGNVENADYCMQSQKRFLKEHLFTWVFEWCNLVFDYAITDFYRGIAYVLQGILLKMSAEVSLVPPQDKTVAL